MAGEDVMRMELVRDRDAARREAGSRRLQSATSNSVADEARKALEKRLAQIATRFFTQFLGAVFSETLVYLLVPFFVMNFQLWIVNLLRWGRPLTLPFLPPALALHPLEYWEILLILSLDLFLAMLVILLFVVITKPYCLVIPSQFFCTLFS